MCSQSSPRRRPVQKQLDQVRDFHRHIGATVAGAPAMPRARSDLRTFRQRLSASPAATPQPKIDRLQSGRLSIAVRRAQNTNGPSSARSSRGTRDGMQTSPRGQGTGQLRTRTSALPSAGRRAIWFIVAECVNGPRRIRLKASEKSVGCVRSRFASAAYRSQISQSSPW